MMRRRRLGRVLAIALVWVLACSSMLRAQSSDAALNVEKGLESFRRGRFQEAVAHFETLFREAPNDDAILELLGQSEYEVIVRMVSSEDPAISGIGLRLMKLRRTAVRQRIADPELIQDRVDAYLEAAADERLALKLEISRNIGRNAVPYLIEKLGVPNVEMRVNAQLLVAEIGLQAIPPLAAAVDHPNTLVRNSVATLLGTRNIRHPAAAGPLAELKQTDPDDSVREAARKSLATLLEDYGKEEQEAKLYYYWYANELYLDPQRNPFSDPYYRPVVYRLEGEQVVGEEIADFQLAERMAEQALESALELDPADRDTRALLACVIAQELVEYDLGLELFAADDPDLRALLESQRGAMLGVRVPLLYATPRDTLFQGLALALDDQNHVVSNRLIEVIHETGRRGTLPDSLVRALSDSPARTVRVGAAIVLSEWKASGIPASKQDQVISVLAEAVVNSGIRTAHKVMGNQVNVNRFDVLLRDLNLDTYSNSPDVESGIARAGQLPPDLILVDDEVRSDVAGEGVSPLQFFIQRIRKKNPRTANVPILVVVDPSRLEAAEQLYEDKDEKIEVVPSDIDAVTLKGQVIDPLFEGRDDYKARALELSARAAKALERISIGGLEFPLELAVESMTKVLLNRPDTVRVPCINALGNLRELALPSVGTLAQLVPDEENSVDVREAAMLAVAKILDASGGRTPDAVLKIITDGMMLDDLRLRRASYVAFSAASVTPEDAVQRLLAATPPENLVTGGAAGEAGAATAGSGESVEDTGAEEATEETPQPAEEEDPFSFDGDF